MDTLYAFNGYLTLSSYVRLSLGHIRRPHTKTNCRFVDVYLLYAETWLVSASL